MIHNHPTPLLLPMPLRTLSASTRVLLNPEFVKDQTSFARRHGVDLVGEVSQATSFTTNKETSEKDGKIKANIHLVQHKAIRLFTERDSDGDWIRRYDLRPSLLRYETKDHHLTDGDLTAALSTLLNQVTPLLANPLDARHIVPGLVSDDTHIAYWREIESEALIPDVDLLCIHGISHPATGPAEGSTSKRLKLGNLGDFVILIEAAKRTSAGPEGTREVCGVRVRLALRGNALVNSFQDCGKTSRFGNILRLVSFRATGVATVHQEIMSQLEGKYLPVPPEWASMRKSMATSKVIALLSELMPIAPGELRATYEARNCPSRSTQKRLNNEISMAIACMKPVPVSSLFHAEAYADRVCDQRHPLTTDIDPEIAAAYGPDTTSQ